MTRASWQRRAGKDVLVSAINDRLDADLIAPAARERQLIAQFGNGFDNIDIEAAYARRPDRHQHAQRSHRRHGRHGDDADAGSAAPAGRRRRGPAARASWPGWSPTWMLGRRLRGKALGIVGLGRIGTAVAQRARSFGLNIHYFSRNRRPAQLEEALGATYWEELDAMIEEVDIVSLHTPLTRDTHNILNAGAAEGGCARMPSWSTSRGPSCIDEDALIADIESGHLSGAALDVFENRNGISPRLLALARQHRVVLTAHMASATLEARLEMGETVIVNIRAFIDGAQPPHRVLPDSRNRVARG
ncbi:MAG: hypothetical protein NVV63_11730 [Opitutus sp.]|nr:hypothetical protein [Opitutus sp.]